MNEQDAQADRVLSFESADALLVAVRRLIASGARNWTVCAPYECAAVRLANEYHCPRQPILLWTIAGACAGLAGVVALLYFTQFAADPLITQGRVQGWQSVAAYVIPVFEAILLGSGIFCMIGFLKACALPRWYDPVFECEFFKSNEHGEGFFILLYASTQKIVQELSPQDCQSIEGRRE